MSDTPARRIGLFGGSFDPVHRAHVALAREALAALGLDEVRWLPTGQPWQKTRAMTPAAQREALVDDASGDLLDAALCLVQAGWASAQPEGGVPAGCDPVEGWIATVPWPG